MMIIVEITPENEKGPKLFPALSHDLFAVVNRGVCVSLTLHTLVDSCWRCQAINGTLVQLFDEGCRLLQYRCHPCKPARRNKR